jgi:hypothetical protein
VHARDTRTSRCVIVCTIFSGHKLTLPTETRAARRSCRSCYAGPVLPRAAQSCTIPIPSALPCVGGAAQSMSGSASTGRSGAMRQTDADRVTLPAPWRAPRRSTRPPYCPRCPPVGGGGMAEH